MTNDLTYTDDDTSIDMSYHKIFHGDKRYVCIARPHRVQ